MKVRKNISFTQFFLIVFFIVILISAFVFCYLLRKDNFNGARAFEDVKNQVNFGPRIPGSAGHSLEIEYIQEELHISGWKTSLQKTTWNGFSIQNVISYRSEDQPRFLLGAHYDSRMIADQNPLQLLQPVPGANDGASGVAVLLEIARSLPFDGPPIWLVFFDAEDNGGINGREWIMGSRAFVSTLGFTPEAVIILDMVGDHNPAFYYESNSTVELGQSIWQIAEKLGFENYFIPRIKYSILDDHIPFIEKNIWAIDIIDFDYPFWHTTEDTIEKVSPTSLDIVGTTVITWILNQN